MYLAQGDKILIAKLNAIDKALNGLKEIKVPQNCAKYDSNSEPRFEDVEAYGQY
jgi:hypothetical protein